MAYEKEPYYHGVRVLETKTAKAEPRIGTAGLQVVVGTAPVHLAEEPAVHVPVICYSMEDCRKRLGYSEDFEHYTLCQSMDLNFNVLGIGPVIFINVLDPAKHKIAEAEKEYQVNKSQVQLSAEGILMESITVKNGDAVLEKDKDYLLSRDDDGIVRITLLETETFPDSSVVKAAYDRVDASLVTTADIIGGYDAGTGAETGLETIRQIYPRFGAVPGFLLAPGWSQEPSVAAVLAAKSEGINGIFRCENVVDLDTETARLYTDCENAKKTMGLNDPHTIVCWPMGQIGNKVYHMSAVYAAVAAGEDIKNDDVPNLSPDNKLSQLTGTVLKDGTQVLMDNEQANVLNGNGIVTAINNSGWRIWGNNTAAYPEVTDVKERWICCRRFFSWWGNQFIMTYNEKVGNSSDKKLIESICDSENIRGNGYVSQGKCAGIKIEYREDENTAEDMMNGRVTLRQYLAPYTPAEDILNILSFSPEMLRAAMEGGN